jgi:hypothetical protein
LAASHNLTAEHPAPPKNLPSCKEDHLLSLPAATSVKVVARFALLEAKRSSESFDLSISFAFMAVDSMRIKSPIEVFLMNVSENSAKKACFLLRI